MYHINHLSHKDANPIDTIQRIQGILDSIGFKESDRNVLWNSFGDGSYSCLLTFNTYPVLKSNGKGLTKELSLASAYGEYMERFQSHCQHFYFSRIGFFDTSEPLLTHGSKVSTTQLHSKIPEIMKLYTHIDSELPDELECIKFADIFANEEVMVPYELLLYTISTNGMCAGNTPEEALSQGISEIFERYIIALLTEGELDGLPDIQKWKESIHEPKLKHLINLIAEKEYNLVVKDATLGGIFPVIGIIVENKSGTKIGVSFGSDPDFEIALQRCITELFQGKTDLDVDAALLDSNPENQPIASIFNNPHLLYTKLKGNIGTDSHKRAFTGYRGNSSYLSYQIEIVRSLGKKIFIHDFSVLGFPTYQIFIEDLSCTFSKKVIPYYYINKRDDFLYTLFTLDERTPSEIQLLTQKLSSLMHSDYDVFDIHFKKLFMRVPISRWSDPNLLIALLHIESGDYESALKELRFYHPTKGELTLKTVLEDFCTLQIEMEGDYDAVYQKLQTLYGDSIDKKVLNHLMHKNYGSFLKQEIDTKEGKKFENIPIPRCTQETNCTQCYLRIRCYKDSWKIIRERIRIHAVEPDQKRLLALYHK